MAKKSADTDTGGVAPVRLGANENPFGPSPLALDAGRAALELASLYPEQIEEQLCGALAAFHGRGLKAGNFFAANSGVETLSLIEDTALGSGGRAVICPPCFIAYRGSLANKAVPVDEAPLGKDYSVDVDAVLAAVGNDTRLLFLCNPNNPTGTWFGGDVLAAVLDGLPDHVTLVYDEVYYQFATIDGLPDAIRYVLEDRNIAIVHSLSKAYGLAGMRIGYGIAPERIVSRVQQLKRSYHVNSVGLRAATAALGDEAHLKRTVDNNHTERARLTEEMRAMGLEVAPSQANFVMFKCPEGVEAGELTGKLEAMGVLVRPAFDLAETHIRASVGRPEDNTRLLETLKTATGG